MKEVEVKLKRISGNFYWKMEKCPACGKAHHFKAGDYTKNPRASLGWRQIPCGPGEVKLKEKNIER